MSKLIPSGKAVYAFTLVDRQGCPIPNATVAERSGTKYKECGTHKPFGKSFCPQAVLGLDHSWALGLFWTIPEHDAFCQPQHPRLLKPLLDNGLWGIFRPPF